MQEIQKRRLSIGGSESGIALRIQESATELKSFLYEWNKLHASGIVILNSIRILKLDSLNESSQDKLYPQGLQERCDQLQLVLEKMENCIANFAILVQQICALVKLDSLQGKNDNPVYLSWSAEKFRKSYQDIYDAYAKELSLKNAIKEEVAHCSRRDSLLFHITSWTSQPFIENSCILLCEELFLEAGIK